MDTLPIKLRPSRLTWTMVLLISLSFLALEIWLVSGAGCTKADILGFALFGMGAIIASITLHPSGSYLLLTAEGFTYVNLFRPHFIPWDHVQHFVPLGDKVCWNYSKEVKESTKLRKVNREWLG